MTVITAPGYGLVYCFLVERRSGLSPQPPDPDILIYTIYQVGSPSIPLSYRSLKSRPYDRPKGGLFFLYLTGFQPCRIIIFHIIFSLLPGTVMATQTVLIVEDNALNAKLFSDLLTSCGYKTVLSPDGRGVQAEVIALQPDLIILDIQLPQVSGLDIAQTLKAEPGSRDIPVIAVTAFAMKGDDDKILAAGVDAYLSKPVDIPEFLAAVQRLLGTPGD